MDSLLKIVAAGAAVGLLILLFLAAVMGRGMAGMGAMMGGTMMAGGMAGMFVMLLFWGLVLALLVALVMWVIRETQRR